MTSFNASHKPVVILSGTQKHELLCFENPRACVAVTSHEELPHALDALQRALSDGFFVAGWFGYEFGVALATGEALSAAQASVPCLWFGVFNAPSTVSRQDFRAEGHAYAGPLHHEWDREDYRRRFERVQEHIAAGDIYQANLSFRSRFAFSGDPFALFLHLYDAAQVPHAAYIDTGDVQVLSLSPELFFRIDGGVIETQPMKGTAPRGSNADSDRDARETLRASVKNRAENVMIVDLMRNDLGRHARPGTVRVSELFGIRTYPTYHTLVSTITAHLDQSVSIEQLAGALMPAGSITGAPKFRAIKILSELESSPRQVYCGAIGHFDPSGDASFNVAIRTLWLNGASGTTGIGGGVVSDSRADAEYDECLLKTHWYAAPRRAIGLIETLAWDSSFVRLEQHLDRMARSAATLGIAFERSRAYETLAAAVKSATAPQRVRLELDEGGRLQCSTQPIGVKPALWRFVISPEHVNSRDVLLKHKTTWRDLYDGEWRRLCADGQADEVLFLNERGELTEGARTNLFVRLGKTMYTPPADSGLLPGILRAEMLERSLCIERLLTVKDLEDATEIYVGNSLRGLIRVQSR